MHVEAVKAGDRPWAFSLHFTSHDGGAPVILAIDFEIYAQVVQPVFAFGRLYIFWTESEDAILSPESQILRCSYYANGQWAPVEDCDPQLWLQASELLTW